MNFMSGYMTSVLSVILVAILGYLGLTAKRLYTKYINTEMKQSLVRTAVRFVEQVYRDIHGPEKLRAAMEKASELLANQGITITEDELIAMIEAAVNEFNNAFGWTESGKHLPDTKIMGTAQRRFPTMDEVVDNTGG